MSITDYHDFCDINSTREERKKFGIGTIYSNGVKCHKCGWYIRSKNLHHMISCKCGNVSVDGGSWYHKISFKDEYTFTSRVVCFSDVGCENV